MRLNLRNIIWVEFRKRIIIGTRKRIIKGIFEAQKRLGILATRRCGQLMNTIGELQLRIQSSVKK